MNKITLQKLKGDAIAYRPSFAKTIIGKERFGADGAVYLQQLLYWCDKGSRPDGFIYKSKDEIYEETGVSPKVQDRLRKLLLSHKFLETKTLRANGAPTLHYKLNLEEIAKKFISDYADGDVGLRQRDDSITPTVTLDYAQRAHSLTENTTESTQKITTTNNWQAVVLYFYQKISPTTSLKFKKKITRESAELLLSLHSEDYIKSKIDWLATSDKRAWCTTFETFCNKFTSFEIQKPKPVTQPMIYAVPKKPIIDDPRELAPPF